MKSFTGRLQMGLALCELEVLQERLGNLCSGYKLLSVN